jgi:high-affinity iron transporter
VLQAFIIVLREGFESFLIVAIIFAYLRKMNMVSLVPAVYAGIGVSLATSAGFGWWILQGASQPLWEGILGLVSAVLVTAFVVHMWQTAPHLKKDMETKLSRVTSAQYTKGAFFGVFIFTVFMITREGMETALLLIQVHEAARVTGMVLGIAAAAALSLIWVRVGHLINLKLFFQVTALFLLLFVAQILLYSFHEFCEAGILPNSEAWHLATEPYSPDGRYGQWISLGMIAVCGAWLLAAWAKDKFLKKA